ncbi:hypothetical protein MUN88_21405 [Gracilibacillus caseinilyticus]|uniref:DUF5105 domain-containing protein n=1 Tax=Gracilibacillus caseinilyticus TaxID=2932256 RepID=A0ABY4EWE2_9BACI|nr:hypothetical protein [Gracilibacillus caseinilyticus]UOQ48553.1 hypothetical protein MUN88_21405 [Gracilibacillus caseinilyticus]
MKKHLIVLILLAFLSVTLIACSQDTEEDTQSSDDNGNTETIDATDDVDEAGDAESTFTLDENKATEVLNQYHDTVMRVINNADDQGTVSDFTTKEALQEEFMTIMSEELASSYVDQYFQETDGQLFVVPTEAPIWFKEDQAFQMQEVSKTEYEIIQEQTNELIGEVKMTYVLTSNDDKWIVQEVRTEDLGDTSNGDGQNDSSNQSGSDSAGNNENSNKSEETNESNGEITDVKAEALVRQHLNIPEDSEMKVVMDHKDDNGNFVVQVYELVQNGDTSHTATVGWYIVNKDDGSIEEMM